jgi:hypothetical protein
MASWKYDICKTCEGSGSIHGHPCVFCVGSGFWEFIAEDNYFAVEVLVNGIAPTNEKIKEICNRRLEQITPDNVSEVLAAYAGANSDFDAIHQAGSEKWGWAWLHTNRFVIELVKLCGGNPLEHRMACSRLAWKWLSEENQIKIDASIDIQNQDAL